MSASIFDILVREAPASIETLPVTRLARLDSPCLYAIHDSGLVGSFECLWVGRTEAVFERIYNHLTTRRSDFWMRAVEDPEADTESIDPGNWSNELNEKLRVNIHPTVDPDNLRQLERVAIGRIGPRYNERDRYKGGYEKLRGTERSTINSLMNEPLVPPKVGGTYALLASDPQMLPVTSGECLKVGRTDNLNSRLNDHIRNRSRSSCLRHMVESEFGLDDMGATGLRSDLVLTFEQGVNCEAEWESFFDPLFPEF